MRHYVMLCKKFQSIRSHSNVIGLVINIMNINGLAGDGIIFIDC